MNTKLRAIAALPAVILASAPVVASAQAVTTLAGAVGAVDTADTEAGLYAAVGLVMGIVLIIFGFRKIKSMF